MPTTIKLKKKMKKNFYICAIKINNQWEIKTLRDHPFYFLPEMILKQSDGDSIPVEWKDVQDYKFLEKL